MDFPAWKTVKLGTHPSMVELALAAVDEGSQISWLAGQMLAKASLAPLQIELELVRASARDLGMIGETSRTIFSKASEYGLDPCPLELGVQLRRQYTNQPKNEQLLIATEPTKCRDGRQRVFSLEYNGEVPILQTYLDEPGDVWSLFDIWIFTRRKQ